MSPTPNSQEAAGLGPGILPIPSALGHQTLSHVPTCPPLSQHCLARSCRNTPSLPGQRQEKDVKRRAEASAQDPLLPRSYWRQWAVRPASTWLPLSRSPSTVMRGEVEEKGGPYARREGGSGGSAPASQPETLASPAVVLDVDSVLTPASEPLFLLFLCPVIPFPSSPPASFKKEAIGSSPGLASWPLSSVQLCAQFLRAPPRENRAQCSGPGPGPAPSASTGPLSEVYPTILFPHELSATVPRPLLGCKL